MTWQYTHPFWKRTWRIEADGIHEERIACAGRRIGWDDLDRLGKRSARSRGGTRISLVLGPRESEEFFTQATREWQRRFPDREVANALRLRKSADLAVYFWLPLLTLLSGLVLHLLFWWMGFPEFTEAPLSKIQRCMVIGVLLWCATVWLYRRERKRREAQAQA